MIDRYFYEHMNFSQKCGLACEFIPFINREDFREEFIYKNNEQELTDECREFLCLCCNDYERYKKYITNIEKFKIPGDLKKFIKN